MHIFNIKMFNNLDQCYHKSIILNILIILFLRIKINIIAIVQKIKKKLGKKWTLSENFIHLAYISIFINIVKN